MHPSRTNSRLGARPLPHRPHFALGRAAWNPLTRAPRPFEDFDDLDTHETVMGHKAAGEKTAD